MIVLMMMSSISLHICSRLYPWLSMYMLKVESFLEGNHSPLLVIYGHGMLETRNF